MDWIEYKNAFTQKAIETNLPIKEVEQCLAYADRLFKKGLPVIFDRTHFSLLVGYKKEFLNKICLSKKYFYRSFEIKKRNGKSRNITEPLPSLKEIQNWILQNILYRCEVSDFVKSYTKNRSIKDNARFHKGQKYLLTIDIKDFFGSIHFGKVFYFFHQLGYTTDVANLIANLCTFRRSLPQGAPTSPALSNLVTVRLDHRIASFSLKHKIRYTRYSDDLAFSGDFDIGKLSTFVERVLNSDGYYVNKDKTRLMKKHTRQIVTGIVVNEKMQAPRTVRSKIRQELYYIEKFGLASHLEKSNIDKGNYIYHLLGLANHVLFINPKDTKMANCIIRIKKYLTC